MVLQLNSISHESLVLCVLRGEFIHAPSQFFPHINVIERVPILALLYISHCRIVLPSRIPWFDRRILWIVSRSLNCDPRNISIETLSILSPFPLFSLSPTFSLSLCLLHLLALEVVFKLHQLLLEPNVWEYNSPLSFGIQKRVFETHSMLVHHIGYDRSGRS